MKYLFRLSRRALIRTLAFGAVATAVTRQAHSTEPQQIGGQPPKVSPLDPDAVALGYVEDTARVDVKRYPSYVKGSLCDNCLQLQGPAGDTYRPCGLFNGKRVSVNGWCSGWTAQM